MLAQLSVQVLTPEIYPSKKGLRDVSATISMPEVFSPSLDKGDLASWAAGALLILIVIASVLGLVLALGNHANAGLYKDSFDVIVKGALLPIFIALSGLKVGSAVAVTLASRSSMAKTRADQDK